MWSICTNKNSSFTRSYPELCDPPEDWAFNPDLESHALLVDWMTYRGYDDAFMDKRSIFDLRQYVKRDLSTGPSPPFSRFVDWDAEDASSSFLASWLSHYGVSSNKMESREWWENKVRTMQKLVKPWRKSLSVSNSFQALVVLENKAREMDRLLRKADECFRQLPEEDREEAEEAIVEQQVERVKRTWNRKRLLSYLLYATALAAPISYNLWKNKYRMQGMPAEQNSSFWQLLGNNAGRVMVPMSIGMMAGELGKRVDLPSSLTAPLTTAAISDMINSQGMLPASVLSVLLFQQFKASPLMLSFLSDVLVPSINQKYQQGPSLTSMAAQQANF